jgi:general secretion pathway protein G
VTKPSSLIDPWGHPYVYRQPGQQGGDYDLYSLGAEGTGQPSTASTQP